MSKEIEKIIESFIQDKIETFLDQRLLKIEKSLEEHDKIINLENDRFEKVKDSLSSLKKEHKKSIRKLKTGDKRQNLKRKTKWVHLWLNFVVLLKILIKKYRVSNYQCKPPIILLQI
ncbi:unnamed protein product [Blepharisma stoltei]|uniref:Uncharacterized protein n=1 Tax=Blepharisma stoltei TaxID=1481888 RepID=A0AAU9JKE1_9CILI|nr:unnamed protein product [Blepharisma stoltei]